MSSDPDPTTLAWLRYSLYLHSCDSGIESPTPLHHDKRFPLMPHPNDILQSKGFKLGPRYAKTRMQPPNGPPLQDWNDALVGRKLLKPSAAYTRDQDSESPSVASVRGVLLWCINHAGDRPLSRVPVEIVRRVEHLLHVSTFKRSDLPADTRFRPGAYDCASRAGRLNVWLDKDNCVDQVFYG